MSYTSSFISKNIDELFPNHKVQGQLACQNMYGLTAAVTYKNPCIVRIFPKTELCYQGKKAHKNIDHKLVMF